jgi:AraC family transcriptional regulator, regulatory protein of adaptative response / DNA-3-methyladenine glycosylase II
VPSLDLAYRHPFDWDALLGYLSRRAIPGVEAVTPGGGGSYWRTIRLHGHQGYLVVASAMGALNVELSPQLVPVRVPLLARLRRLFDLDANPQVVSRHLSRDAALAPLVSRRPGMRLPGTVDGFELALRAVLGQQVTVVGASTLAGRLAQLLAEPLPGVPAALTHLPISAERLAEASLRSIVGIGLPRRRATCLVSLGRAVAAGALPELSGDVPRPDPVEFERRLAALPGIGAWTASYVAMRALHWPDAFPEDDIGLRKAMGGLSPARLRMAAEAWRPWRAYAAQHLWASLGDRVRSSLPAI